MIAPDNVNWLFEVRMLEERKRSVKQVEKDVRNLLKEVMVQCKKERKAKTELSNKELASELEITENYLSALESARAIPSLQVFFRYLLANGFDVSPLKALEIKDTERLRSTNKARSALIQKIYSFDDDQVNYLIEQAKIAELFALRIKIPGNRVRRDEF